MALLQTFHQFTAGQLYSYTYSPKWLKRYGKYPPLLTYDKAPLSLFINYDNIYGLISAVNLHWLTEAQRTHLLDVMTRVFPVADLREWGKPVNITWEFIRGLGLPYMMAWRRYFPARMRNIRAEASTWDYDELMKDVVHAQTQKIIGVTPEYIQQYYAASIARKNRQFNYKQHLAEERAKMKQLGLHMVT